MSSGRLNGAQSKVLVQYTKDEIVHDLGAGSLELARYISSHGARKVIAIDKEFMPAPGDSKIEVVWAYFDKYAEPIDVAFVSWPANYPNDGLLALVERARLVIYVGKNTDGSMCGWPGLFWSLLGRELLAYVPDRRNVLAVYGQELPKLRHPTGEELAGLTTYERMYSYEEAEREAHAG